MTARRSKISVPAPRHLTAPVGRPRGRIFRREGEYWTIVYEGTLFRLRDGKGPRYLAHLLSCPDERIHCADLWAVTGRGSGADVSAERTRVAVTKRIKASVAKIATLHPALGAHLNTRIKTGYFCVYISDADGPVSWKP
jgi:hypothetical protein